MRVFKNKPFLRFMKHEGITDAELWEAVRRAERGLVDADLGGEVIKQRLARPGEGRSGGVRSIVVFRRGERAFFVHGFAKKDRANIKQNEERAFKRLAAELLGYGDRELREALKNGTLVEIKRHGEAV